MAATAESEVALTEAVLAEALKAGLFHIYRGLFLSAFFTTLNTSALKKAGIVRIINLSDAVDQVPSDEQRKHFEVVYVPIADDTRTDIISYMLSLSDLIHHSLIRDHKRVLVNCNAGQSRSVSLIITYLMRFADSSDFVKMYPERVDSSKKAGLTLTQALEFVISKRKEASPNPGFMRQLMTIECETFGWDESPFDWESYVVRSFQTVFGAFKSDSEIRQILVKCKWDLSQAQEKLSVSCF